MEHRVKAYVKKYHMLEKKDKVIVGVSGGADSVCLLFMLLGLQKEMEISVIAVHVHHGLRGKSADADAQYVQQICKEQGIELYTYYEDVARLSKLEKLTLEEAGRIARRRVFQEVMEKCGGTKIALAHHENDNAETLIWNLSRGCGLKGMGGISPIEGVYIRPLLCLQRKEIESYLENRGISYCTDETNLEENYTRNRIRKHVIPYLETEINRKVVAHMSETMSRMRELEEYIRNEAIRYAKCCVKKEEKDAEKRMYLIKEEFLKVPKAVRPYILQELLCQMAGQRKDIESIHVQMLGELLEKQVGREMYLPYGILANRSYEGLEIRKREEKMSKRMSKTGENGQDITAMRVFDKSQEIGLFPQNPYTKWFDYDKIKDTVQIRHREPGDYITIDRNGGTQKLKQYFINEKIPKEIRNEIWLAADGNHIIWIIGYRQNQAYQITEDTRKILEIEFYGGREDGRKG